MQRTGFFGRIKTLLFIAAILYTVVMLFEQHTARKEYEDQAKVYATKIQEEHARAEHLEKLKLEYSTDQYIEKIAREKLGLVKYDEKVFIDVLNN